MSYSLSVIAPFLNEEQNLNALLERTVAAVEAMKIDYEIILVDDGSDDGSLEVVEGFRAAHPSAPITVVSHPTNRGIFPSWHTGLNASTKNLSVLIDSDLQNPPEAIGMLYDAFLANPCHFVQGSRSSIEFRGEGRLLFSRGLNALLNLAFGSQAADHKSGFVLGPTEIFKESLTFTSQLTVGQTFIRAGIESRGYLVHEIETIFFPRPAGTSFLAGKLARTILRALFEIGVVKREIRKRGKTPHLYPLDTLRSTTRPSVSRTTRERFYRWLFFATLRLHTWNISGNAKKYLDILEHSDWLSPEQIQDATAVRLRRLLWHVFGRVPHYRRFFIEQSMLPSDISGLDDMTKLPLLGKDDVRASLHFDLFAVGANRRRLHRISTSGSTGMPFTTYADWDQLDIRFATTLRAQQMTGWRFGDRQMRLWHQNLGMRKSEELRERLNARISRRTFIPAFELDEDRIRDLINLIEREKPVLIDGYAESFNYLSRAISEGSLTHSPQAVMTSAQILTKQTREDVEAKFSTKVFDKYGSREFSGIAYECDAHDGHHIQWESYIVEILKDGKPVAPGESGEVVVTDLNNFSVPLIRYRIGDLAEAMAPAVCGCGRNSARIGSIIGRTQALVLVSGGKWLPGAFFAHFFKEYDTIVNQFQVVQGEADSFTLKIVKGSHWSQEPWQACLKHLHEYVGDDIRIDVEFVDQIPLLRTGKRTPVVSTLKVDFQSL